VNIFELIIVQPVFNLLTFIYGLLPWQDFGVAVILFTVIVRFLMYPLVRRQLHQTRKMRQLQPELKKIKKNADGNKQVEAMQMMEMYKRHGVSPFRSIGILLIQLPIFIGLFYAIRIYTSHREDIEMFTYGFVQQIGAVGELISNPASFNENLFGVVDLTKHAVGSEGIDIILVGLALLAAVTQFIMSKQTMPHTESSKGFKQIMAEAAEGKQADQSEMNTIVMQNMMKIMPFFMFFIMINLPAALALYYTVSNLVAVGQQAYLLRQDEEELEEIADEPTIQQSAPTAGKGQAKKAKTTERESKAKQAHVTRITANDKKTKRRKT
jgi:YidC/Oxa1 family membrane protein insertase